MSTAAGLKQFRPVLEELRVQGWEVENTENGHIRAVPPDRTKPIVHFSASTEPRAFQNTVADLRRSGFDWPPAGAPHDDANGSIDEEAMGLVEPLDEPLDLDKMFESLKAAKEYRALAHGDLLDKERALAEAEERYRAEIARLQRGGRAQARHDQGGIRQGVQQAMKKTKKATAKKTKSKVVG